MSTLQIINLGTVKAIISGTTPPVNTQLIWYDTTVNAHKAYNIGTASWVLLGSGGSSGSQFDILTYNSSTLGPPEITSYQSTYATLLGNYPTVLVQINKGSGVYDDIYPPITKIYSGVGDTLLDTIIINVDLDGSGNLLDNIRVILIKN